LTIFHKLITGLKIECKGKWKKTRSGRKQKLNISFGKIQKNTLTNIIFYHSNSQETKYGKCSIKIWISYNKTTQLNKLKSFEVLKQLLTICRF